MNELKNKIIDNLKEVYDPEIPINVYDLGLIYEVNVKESGNVNILMTLTSPTCPTAEYIQTMVEDAVKGTDGVKEVDIEMTFDPVWTPEKVSEDAKEELGLVEGSEDLGVQNMFSTEKEGVKENICFNCGASDLNFPIMSCKFKGEDTFICSKCMNNFK